MIPWYQTWFDSDEYELVYKHRSEEEAIVLVETLIPGGYFVQDYLNATKVRANFVPRSESETGAVHVVQERAIVGQRVEKEITISQNGERYVFNESVRLYELEDFERMYQQAGLSLIRTMGNYDGSDWHEDCPRLILISSRVTT